MPCANGSPCRLQATDQSPRRSRRASSTVAIPRPASLLPASANSGARSSPPCNRSAASSLLPTPAAARPACCWEIEIGKQGQLLAIKPFEQKRGPRGWGRPKALSLMKIAGNEHLPACDLKVARALRAERGYSNRFTSISRRRSSLWSATPASFSLNAPEQLVELSEAAPGTGTASAGRALRDARRATAARRARARRDLYDSEDADDAPRERSTAPDHARPGRPRSVCGWCASRGAAAGRAARLGTFAVPADAAGAQAEVDKTLRALAGRVSRCMPTRTGRPGRSSSDSRLRAELSPVGDHLSLRLVVTPLGPDGPRLPAASGRLR
jgi:hypothetical protein